MEKQTLDKFPRACFRRLTSRRRFSSLVCFVGSSFELHAETWCRRQKSCGFQAVRVRNAYRDLWFITGTKPDRH
jgi:hypothetical protein